ncbi:MAG: DUF2398 family protein [Bacilli bacterium]|nr:DUF2398 family protein [Bacilli bacterium]
MEFKEELELLLNNFLITKENNKEAYYKIKSKIKKIREFATSKLGCDVIVNSSLIKLEKIPSIIDNTFSISDFNDQKDYIFFILIIMFLEDKARDEQFILSNLTTFILNLIATIEVKKVVIDFKDYTTRKSLVKVLKYLVKLGVIKQIDGNDLLFKESVENEVLYENTGISHYLVRQFKEDIFSYKEASDFLNTLDTEELLNKKRYYTYRTLLFYPIFNYSLFDAEIYNYFLNYRGRITSDIKELLDGDLLIFNNLAILTTVEKPNRINFPNTRKMSHDIVLLVSDYIVNELDRLDLDKLEFKKLVRKVQQENSKYFNKEFREMKEDKFFLEVTSCMESFGLLKITGDNYQVSDIVYLISGNYEKEEEKEDSMYEQLSIGEDL